MNRQQKKLKLKRKKKWLRTKPARLFAQKFLRTKPKGRMIYKGDMVYFDEFEKTMVLYTASHNWTTINLVRNYT